MKFTELVFFLRTVIINQLHHSHSIQHLYCIFQLQFNHNNYILSHTHCSQSTVLWKQSQPLPCHHFLLFQHSIFNMFWLSLLVTSVAMIFIHWHSSSILAFFISLVVLEDVPIPVAIQKWLFEMIPNRLVQ
jgi:hypothetical protein